MKISGGRTNPWYQECSDKIIRPGDLVAFDTDLVGPFGHLRWLLALGGLSVVLFFVGYWVFDRLRDSFAEAV